MKYKKLYYVNVKYILYPKYRILIINMYYMIKYVVCTNKFTI